MKIVFTGGGTYGHIMPIIAVSRELKRLYQKEDLHLYYIGPNDTLSLFLLHQENIKTSAIVAGKVRRYFSFANIIDILFKIPVSFVESFFLVLFIKPQLVFSKGGTGALPVAFCANLLGIPVFLHESDIVPGMSNQVASKWAKKIFVSFEKTEYFNLSKTQLTGNPIKSELSEGTSEGAKEYLQITFEKPVILFIGGSQGAQPLNDFVLEILDQLLTHYEVIHLCGRQNFGQVKPEAEVILAKETRPYYHLYESLDEIKLKHAYAAASVIVSRAGASSIFEIAAAGKPSILIPLPTAAGDHQSKNAYQYAKDGAAIIIEQDNLTANFFMGQLQNIVSNPQKSQEMQTAALQFAKPLAAKAIAREILEYLHEKET